MARFEKGDIAARPAEDPENDSGESEAFDEEHNPERRRGDVTREAQMLVDLGPKVYIAKTVVRIFKTLGIPVSVAVVFGFALWAIYQRNTALTDGYVLEVRRCADAAVVSEKEHTAELRRTLEACRNLCPRSR